MTTLASTRATVRWPSPVAWLPLFVLPAAAAVACAKWPAWAFMWALAFSMYAGLKWLTLADSPFVRQASLRRSLAYLLLWPGMDADAFLAGTPATRIASVREWLAASTKLFGGLALIYVVAPLAAAWHPLLAGWCGMIGIVSVLHFGLVHLLSLVWRRAGIDAVPIMNRPLHATSLSDFWGRRWNLAFRDAAHAYVFRPLVARLGMTGAMLAVFLVSGIIHDIAVSTPPQAGFGLPTLYFLLQGAAMLVERSRAGKRLGLGRGLVGRLYTGLAVLAPAGLLFHPPFVYEVVLPTLHALGSNVQLP